MTTPQQLTVLIVDDHPLVRRSLQLFLGSQRRFSVCGEAASAEEALLLGPKLKPDIVILDLSLNGKISMEAIKSIREELPRCKVLVFTALDEESFGARCIKNGASGYVQKGDSLETLSLALSQVADGHLYLSLGLVNQLLAGDEKKVPAESLSDKEFEVFLLYGQGLSTREVAERLQRSVKTIQAHRENINDKYQLKSTSEFIAAAMKCYSNSLHKSSE